jgi:hypothetical protein
MLDKITDIINNGLIIDVFKAEQAIFVNKLIGKYADEINSSSDSTKAFFVYIQNLTFSEAILSLSRIYDKPDNKFPNRCILGLINLLNDKSLIPPPVLQDNQTIEHIKTFGLSDILIKDIEEKDYQKFARHFSWHLKSKYFHDDFLQKISDLKNIRDKELAHNEQKVNVFKISWKTCEDLLIFSKMIIGIIGWAYLSTVYLLDKKYELTPYAKTMECNLLSIFKRLDIIKNGA